MKKLIALFGFVLVFSAFSHRANAWVGQILIGDGCHPTLGIAVEIQSGSDPYNFLVEVFAPEMQYHGKEVHSVTLPHTHNQITTYEAYLPLSCSACQWASGCPARITADPTGQNVERIILVPCTRPPGYCY